MVGRGSRNEVITPQLNSDISSIKTISIREYFLEYLFPDAIIYGMSYDEFWNKDPQLYFSYRFSFLKKQKLKREEENYNAWLYGLYNFKALSISLYNSFREKKDEPMLYFNKPLDFEEMSLSVEEKTTKAQNVKNKWASLKSRMKGE